MNTKHTRWIKSSHSYANGNCVEVAALPSGKVAIRDSKHPDGQVLTFTPRQWRAFTLGVRAGEFSGA